ncbi:MAG: FHA domain-containing protein, partial [Clostridia bacterium]|nr:FHA domain-containing protein [Deltaproteobacteria bacterium]
GRTDENDIAIDHRSVSRHHAKVVMNQRSYRIMDLKSANGTLVNGEEYAQTELKRGDLVELGHVRFRFIPPNSSYELTHDELQAIRVVNPSARRGDTVRPGARSVPTVDTDVQSINMAPTAINQWSDELASIQRRRRFKPLIVAGVAAFAVIAVGGTVIYKLSNKGERSSLTNTNVVNANANKDGLQSGNPQVNDMMTRATNALAQKQWGEARKLSEAVLVLQPGYPQALEVQKRSTDEMLGQAALDKAKDSIEAHRLDDAWRQLGEVPEGTVAAGNIPPMRAQVRYGQIAVKAADARAKIEAGKTSEVRAIINEISEIDPSSPEIRALDSQLESARVVTVADPSSPVGALNTEPAAKLDKNGKRNDSAAKSAKEPKTSPQAPVAATPAPTPAPVVKTSQAPTPAPATAPISAPTLAPAPTPAATTGADSKTYYSQGLQALQQQDTDKAIELLDKCVKTDTKAGMCYRALGISYARLKNGPKAAKYYRMYLRVQPDAKDAAQVEQLLKAYENNANQ